MHAKKAVDKYENEYFNAAKRLIDRDYINFYT